MKVAAVLVGGFGTRLQSVVSDVPKPLAPVSGKPFLFFILEVLAKKKYTDVVLLTGYMHDKIVETCGDGHQFGFKIHYSHEHNPLGTAGALKLAEPYLAKTPDFLLLNGDSFCPEAITALSEISTFSEIGLIAVSYVPDASRFGTVKFDEHTKKILAFQEKIPNISGYVNAGVYRLSSKILSDIPADQNLSLEQNIFPAIVKANQAQLAVCVIKTNFDDIGLPESYQKFIDKTQQGNFYES